MWCVSARVTSATPERGVNVVDHFMAGSSARNESCGLWQTVRFTTERRIGVVASVSRIYSTSKQRNQQDHLCVNCCQPYRTSLSEKTAVSVDMGSGRSLSWYVSLTEPCVSESCVSFESDLQALWQNRGLR